MEKDKKNDKNQWEILKQRLEITQKYFEKGFKPGNAERIAILKQRAKELAKEPVKEFYDDNFLTVVEFMLAHERYALELNFVREVYPLKDLTPLPCTPSFVPGIINIRSQIISLVDLKKFFELPDEGITDLNRVIILHCENIEFGILADEILGVRLINAHNLQSYLPTLTAIGAEYLKGISEDRTIILDGEKILADPKIVVHEDIAA